MNFLDEWDGVNGPQSIALLVCATIADLLHVKRRVEKLIEEGNIDIQVRVTTLDKIEASGMASMLWEEV